MSEQRLQKYRPGDQIDMVVHIEHAPMHLREVSARFFSQGQEEGGIISHMDLSGTPSINEDQPSQQLRLSGKVAPDGAPGVYRLNRLTVKTYGGREHHYSAEELDEMGFEIVEEPDNRPVVSADTDGVPYRLLRVSKSSLPQPSPIFHSTKLNFRFTAF